MKVLHAALLTALLVLFSSTAAFAYTPPTGQMPHPVAADQFDAQHAAAVAQNPAGLVVDLETEGVHVSYQPGERIELKVSISGGAAGYKADIDRLARIEYFSKDDIYYQQADGVADPAPDYYYRYGAVGVYDGPGPRVSAVSWTPVVFEGTLNEWLRFSKPGQYRIYLVTNRVSPMAGQTAGLSGFDLPLGGEKNALSVASNVLTITIAPPIANWEASTIADAAADLNAGPNGFGTGSQVLRMIVETSSEEQAAETLRYLGTPDAVKILIDHMGQLRLWDAWNSWVFINSERALYEAQDRPAAYAEMQRCIADPQFPVRIDFLNAASRLKAFIDAAPGNAMRPLSATNRDRSGDYYEDLVAETARYVESKTEPAREPTLYTLFYEAVNKKSSPKHDVAAAASAATTRYGAEMVEHLDLMTREEISSLLDRSSNLWPEFSKLPIGPPLAHLVAAESTPSDIRSRAAQCLMEIDPAQARAAILADMVRPHPQLDPTTLDSLPDRVLPVVDVKIAANLSANTGFDDAVKLTTLLARYGTSAVLPEVKAYADGKWGQWACSIQAPLLAYFLRVDPDYGQSAFAQCLASRAGTGCYRMLFTNVGAIYPCDALQSIALDSLADPSNDVIADAANYLRMYGTANSESALIAALTAYNKRAATVQPVSSSGYNYDAAGAALVQAITASPSAPLLTSSMIEALSPLCVTGSEKDELTSALNSQPDYPAIWIDPTACRIAQYNGVTIEQVERIAVQYPAGTKLTIYNEGYGDGFAAKAEAMRRYLVAHKMTVTVMGN